MDFSNMPKSQLSKLTEVVKKAIQETQDKYDKIGEDLKEYKDLLLLLTDENKTEHLSESVKDNGGKVKSQRDAIRMVLSQADELLTTDEIYKKVDQLSPGMISGGSRNDRITKVSAALSSMTKKKGDLGRIENPKGQGYLYGKSEWFNETGFPKEQFLEKAKNRGYRIHKKQENEDLLSPWNNKQESPVSQ